MKCNLRPAAVGTATIGGDRVLMATYRSEADNYFEHKRRELQDEVNRKIKEALELEMDHYGDALDATVMWVLHKQFGFGVRRLRRVWEAVCHERISVKQMILRDADEATKRYNDKAGIGKKDWDFYLIQMLENDGIPIRAWEAEPAVESEDGTVTATDSSGRQIVYGGEIS